MNDNADLPDADDFGHLGSVEDAFQIVHKIEICPVFGEGRRERGAGKTTTIGDYDMVVSLRYSVRYCEALGW